MARAEAEEQTEGWAALWAPEGSLGDRQGSSGRRSDRAESAFRRRNGSVCCGNRCASEIGRRPKRFLERNWGGELPRVTGRGAGWGRSGAEGM